MLAEYLKRILLETRTGWPVQDPDQLTGGNSDSVEVAEIKAEFAYGWRAVTDQPAG